MFITTKAEFVWDGEKYVEIHTEGYEYKGDLALADIEDDLEEQERHTGASGNYGSVMPSLYDLTTKDIGSIMSDMGFSSDEIKKYAGYVPTYDPWKEEYAAEELALGKERIGMEKSGIKRQRELSSDLYGIGQQSLMQQIGASTDTGEQSLYGMFQQGAAVQSGGLGQRVNITGRGRKSAIEQSAQQASSFALQGLEQQRRYESSMDDFQSQLQMAGLQERGLDIDYRKDVEASQRAYEDEFWDFMTFLKTEFDIGFDD